MGFWNPNEWLYWKAVILLFKLLYHLFGGSFSSHQSCITFSLFIWRSFSITLQMIPAGGWKWKWSNSVLKSEMGIFWCISITNNVKSYKKFDGKAQTAKFTVFAREISSTALKTWKTRKTKTWITQNFQILYHIQGAPLESWRPEVSENVVLLGCTTF